MALPVPPALIEVLADAVAKRLADHLDARSPWMNVEGAADYIGCPPSRIYKLSSAGKIPVHRDGDRLLFHRDELDAYIRRGGAKLP
jgi:excisionase family DNA binding protein